MTFDKGVATPTHANIGYRSHRRLEVAALLPVDLEGLRILEVGCGEGLFSVAMQGPNEVWGIEPHAPSAAVAKDGLFKVFTSTFEAAKEQLPTCYFDLVICNDVIEHMTDHDSFLRSIQDHMVPGGFIVGSIPNVRHYKNLFDTIFVADWHYQDFGTLDRTHFRFFTMKSWRRSLEQAGFVVEVLKGLNGPIGFGRSLWSVAYALFAYSMIGVSGGRAWDVRYLQIGFRAALPKQSV